MITFEPFLTFCKQKKRLPIVGKRCLPEKQTVVYPSKLFQRQCNRSVFVLIDELNERSNFRIINKYGSRFVTLSRQIYVNTHLISGALPIKLIDFVPRHINAPFIDKLRQKGMISF
jgi:hypothetical protein